MPNTVNEQEPGVYVRQRRSNEDAEFLWDYDPRKGEGRDRLPLGAFIGGLALGVVVTVGLSFLVLPKLLHGSEEKQAAQPPQVEQRLLTPTDLQERSQPVTPEEALKPTPPTQGKSGIYAVQDGDTLGSIAIKFYHSSRPSVIEKIQLANHLTDADTLSLGQKLIIPSLEKTPSESSAQ